MLIVERGRVGNGGRGVVVVWGLDEGEWMGVRGRYALLIS